MRELGDAYSRSTSDIRPGVKGGGGGGGWWGERVKHFWGREEVQSLTLLYSIFDS